MPKHIGILGKKIGMTRVYNEEGRVVPVTVIMAGPCVVLQKKNIATDGYNAIQVGFLPKRESRLNNPAAGHVKLAGKGGFYHIKEFRVADSELYELGQEITLTEVLQIGDLVEVSARTKGRGFQGVMKRHGFKGGGASHGSMFHRAPGSIGCSAWPSRVVKGKKLPGHMGTNMVTTKNLLVVDIRSEENVLLVKGAVPGAKQGIVHIYTL
ncbi:MAG: 50S ribosomal protein L3 [Deltaproteobacteria bacterium RIFOXYD12_FULL_57_12]|nr:MAG: 50S ribosomal protein L3 [Deltaproteobacteria bacterium RIFOXYD12_FULL_57_12]